MHELYELKDKLCNELKDYSKQQISSSNLSIIDTLTHAVKNLDKIIEVCEMEEYSNAYGGSSRGGSYDDGMSRRGGSYGNGGLFGNNYDGSYESGYSREGSYARGRGRGAARDSMGRYSRAGSGDTARKLRELMNNVQDERTREEIRKLADKMEQM